MGVRITVQIIALLILFDLSLAAEKVPAGQGSDPQAAATPVPASGGGSTARQGTAQPTLVLQLTPNEVVNGFPAQLAITVENDIELEGASLEIQPPPGFHADPSTIALPAFSKKVTLATRLVSTREVRRSGENLVIVVLRGAPVGGREPRRITAASLEFKYSPEIRVSRFLLLGSLGILIGYGLRVVLEVLKSVPRPSPAPEVPPVDGPITRFVKQNFYLVDLLVAFGLGFLALVALTRDGRPPGNGTYWYTALSLGVSLGLLTNSELLTRK